MAKRTDQSDQYAIRTVGLTKRFGDRVCVDELNLEVKKGELYALLGDNGAGKTTTINMLTTLLKPSSGEFYICGHKGGRDSEAIKGLFGIVSQDVAIYQELTAYENLRFIADLYGIAGAEAKSRIDRLLFDAGLSERANDRVAEFSGGMQRKLSIASALLHEPVVLFMDEPTVGLDPASRRQIWYQLVNLKKKGVTILLTTHYLEEAELLATRIGIIRQGKLVVEGTIDDLRFKIRGIRGIAIRLSQAVSEDEIEPRLVYLRESFKSEVYFDELRNTIHMSQPEDAELMDSMKEVMGWLAQEKIAFSSFATSEPNLEEVFLAVADGSDKLS
ncbi:MAG: ABC transporter ATP-binding protein [Candidatus Obscuribacterales bacterium]|nr:ABC transporter ATP-binding protein [Candidatus Obscuribacterales bacterium]